MWVKVKYQIWLKIDPEVFVKKRCERTTHEKGRQPIAIGHLSDSGDLIKRNIPTEQIVIWSYAVEIIFLIGGQLKINTFSFQTFTVDRTSVLCKKQLIINANEMSK